MEKPEIFYMDDEENIVQEDVATQARIIGEDENGERFEHYIIFENDSK